MEIDALIERLLGDLFLPLLLGVLSAAAYLAVLARAHQRTRTLIRVALECRRRRGEEERFERRVGFSPRLERLRRLEAELVRRLAR